MMKQNEKIGYIFTINKKKLLNDLGELNKLILCKGIDSYRLNMSDLIEAELLFPKIKDLREYGSAKLMLDLPYPKAKCRVYCNEIGKKIKLNDIYKIYYNCYGMKDVLYFDRLSLAELYFTINETLVIGDGEGYFKVVLVHDEYVEVRALNEFILISGKSIKGRNTLYNNSEIFSEEILEKYIKYISPDSIALSFVSSVEEIEFFRKQLNYKGKIYSKIELDIDKDSLNQIIMASDGVMLGRGDYCLYNSLSSLYDFEKYLSDICSQYEKEYVVATDVLRTLKNQYYPSRADIIDFMYIKSLEVQKIVFNAGQSIEQTISVADELQNNICNRRQEDDCI